MIENIVKNVKTLEEIYVYAQNIYTLIRTDIIPRTLDQKSYTILKKFYDNLFLRAIDLGETDEWFTLPDWVEDARFLTNWQYN